MKRFLNTVLKTSMLIVVLLLVSCSNNDENLDLTIQEKIEILESNEWLLKGFENNVMHTFKEGKRYTFYGKDGKFDNEAIPGTESYTKAGELLMMDFNFGNEKTFELQFSCKNRIVSFYENGELNSTLYLRNSNYQECL